jgi:hypothetical protein
VLRRECGAKAASTWRAVVEHGEAWKVILAEEEEDLHAAQNETLCPGIAQGVCDPRILRL